jgi:hypothetical protein
MPELHWKSAKKGPWAPFFSETEITAAQVHSAPVDPALSRGMDVPYIRALNCGSKQVEPDCTVRLITLQICRHRDLLQTIHVLLHEEICCNFRVK